VDHDHIHPPKLNRGRGPALRRDDPEGQGTWDMGPQKQRREADGARLHTTSGPRSQRPTYRRCAASFCCCSRSMRQAPSQCASSSACAWRFWPSRCSHGRTCCPPSSRPSGTMSPATPASWTSCACFPKRSRRAEKSPCLYVDRYVAARLYHLGIPLAPVDLGSESNSVVIGRRPRPEDNRAAGRQRRAGGAVACQLCPVIA
jgi:hypothetical protein